MPDAPLRDHQLFLLTKRWLTDPENQDVAKGYQSLTLDEFVSSIQAASDALARLHPAVLRQLEQSFTNKLQDDRHVRFFSEQDEPYVSYDQVRDMLERLRTGLKTDGPESPIKQAKAVAATMPRKSAKQDSAETWTKVQLIRTTRSLWRQFTGESAPAIPSGGLFRELVGDLIDFHKFDWDIDSTLRAADKHLPREQTQSFNADR
ncbi:MAG: hypothetical protein AAGB10_23285 [Pseudomonadota bacterium]